MEKGGEVDVRCRQIPGRVASHPPPPQVLPRLHFKAAHSTSPVRSEAALPPLNTQVKWGGVVSPGVVFPRNEATSLTLPKGMLWFSNV